MLEIIVIGYVLLAFGCLCGIGNWLSFISALATKKDTSFIPYIGLGFVLLGMYFIGNNVIQRYWWSAFLIEFTTIPILVSAFIINRVKKTNETT